MHKNNLTICLDFDGVIAHTGELRRIIASRVAGTTLSLKEASGEAVRAGESPLSLETWERVLQESYYAPESMDRVLPVDGSIETITRWLNEGQRVKVVTARADFALEEAMRWLVTHGLEVPVVGVGRRQTKVPHIEHSDLFVDDSPEHVLEAQSVVHQALLFRWPYNEDIHGVRSIRSLKDI